MADKKEEPGAAAAPTQQGFPAPKLVDTLVGMTIGAYRIRRILGGGGMGTAYLTRQCSGPIDRPAVLKFLHTDQVGSEESMRRFEREAAILGRLSFPSVQVYEHGTFEGRPYLAMEYIHGITLGKFKDQFFPKVPLPFWLSVLIICLVGRGLKAAHALKIVHRDIKADNIMLTVGHDARLQVRIIDYGIGKASGNVRRASTGNTTVVGRILGTPDHMSPEQAMGDPVDARTDQYSLAVMAYELFVGHMPFEADELNELFVKVLTAPPPPFGDAPVPPGVEACVMKALSKKRDERYGDIIDFVDELHAASGVDLDKVSLMSDEMQTLMTPPPEAEDEAVPSSEDVPSSGRAPTTAVVGVGDTLQAKRPSRHRRIMIGGSLFAMLCFAAGFILMAARGSSPSRRIVDAGTTLATRPVVADAAVANASSRGVDASVPSPSSRPAFVADVAIVVDTDAGGLSQADAEVESVDVVVEETPPRTRHHRRHCRRDRPCSGDGAEFRPRLGCQAQCTNGCWVCN